MSNVHVWVIVKNSDGVEREPTSVFVMRDDYVYSDVIEKGLAVSQVKITAASLH